MLFRSGTIKPRTLTLPGLPEGVAVGGLALMRQYCLKEPLTAKAPVLIIGGGFTAIDCARVYRRVLGPGVGPITLVVRRTRDLMTATPDELRHIEEEDISIDTLLSPVAARVENGELQGVTLRRNVLGPPGADGRPSVTPLEGSEFEEIGRAHV